VSGRTPAGRGRPPPRPQDRLRPRAARRGRADRGQARAAARGSGSPARSDRTGRRAPHRSVSPRAIAMRQREQRPQPATRVLLLDGGGTLAGYPSRGIELRRHSAGRPHNLGTAADGRIAAQCVARTSSYFQGETGCERVTESILPCRRSRVRVSSAALQKGPAPRGLFVSGLGASCVVVSGEVPRSGMVPESRGRRERRERPLNSVRAASSVQPSGVRDAELARQPERRAVAGADHPHLLPGQTPVLGLELRDHRGQRPERMGQGLAALAPMPAIQAQTTSA
jgi:hypothetical protein